MELWILAGRPAGTHRVLASHITAEEATHRHRKTQSTCQHLVHSIFGSSSSQPAVSEIFQRRGEERVREYCGSIWTFGVSDSHNQRTIGPYRVDFKFCHFFLEIMKVSRRENNLLFFVYYYKEVYII